MNFMAEGTVIGADENLESLPDKTGENEDILEGISDEDESLDGDESEGKPEGKPEDKSKDKDKSSIKQKIKYRERAKKAERELEDTKEALEKARKAAERAPEGSEQERAAKEYIAKLAKEVFDTEKAREKAEELKTLHKFEDKLQEVMDDNPEIPESDLLSIIEELEVEPEVAVKVWKRQSEKPTKPKLPSPKRGSNLGPKMEYTKEDRGKGLFQIGREALKEWTNKGGI